MYSSLLLQSTMTGLNLDTWNLLINNVFLIFLFTCQRFTHTKICFIFFFCKFLAMGNCLNACDISFADKETVNALPIDTIFKLPSPLPALPPGGDFGVGVIDFGGLQVQQISTFQKIWTSNGGGPDNIGATFFEPSPIPEGFSMLGSHAQPNNQPLFGWVLVGKTNATDKSGEILKSPTDYTLIWSNPTESAYFWLPTPPDGYKAVGHVVTTSPEKPSLDKISCVRSDFTDESESDNWIWAEGNGFNVYSSRPKNRGSSAQSVSAGTFFVQTGTDQTSLPLPCLKNNKFTLSTMPNQNQIQTLFESYAPIIYLHPKESHLPSSVNWYFSNGALLYKKGEESSPVPIEPDGSNLPQGGPNDGSYWIDLPTDDNDKEKVKGGDLQSAEAYLHVKPMFGATFTDIQVWLFYPFNGHATAKLGLIKNFPLGKIGEHVGDWEHVTLRISNFDGVLYKVYFAAHSSGRWVDCSLLEFEKGNKFVGYSSLNGHATYYKAGSSIQGSREFGLRNDTDKSDMVIDTGAKYLVVAAEVADTAAVVEPPWLNYAREWGPKISYDLGTEVKKIEKLLFGKFKSMFEKLIDSLPNEIYGEEGPTGPKMKSSWSGDER